MPYLFNIFNIKTNGVTMNGNIDIGPTVHNSHTANTKSVGSTISLGDFSPSTGFMVNSNIDPDVSDQGQVANPSAPVTAQP
ncbi:spore germination protein [Fictibacillus sp. WQ 8-8]|uniref:spore germination protein n=1 Tax=Fictibacillus sp. WQ 8-8 TaxID=2938788 RepID=UPI00210EE7F5|nr:spore germination protein [Fictibacillus sp. WQ 8-8]MCQ6267488.1 spore germination protein [Fictibacillus sp. WQ 8-8]